jgi:hypothetical protein
MRNRPRELQMGERDLAAIRAGRGDRHLFAAPTPVTLAPSLIVTRGPQFDSVTVVPLRWSSWVIVPARPFFIGRPGRGSSAWIWLVDLVECLVRGAGKKDWRRFGLTFTFGHDFV